MPISPVSLMSIAPLAVPPVAVATSALWVARSDPAHTFANASDATSRVTAVSTRPVSALAAGSRSSPRAVMAAGGRPSCCNPSKRSSVMPLRSTFSWIAAVVLSTMSACTRGSSASGAKVWTKRSSSTSCPRAQPPTTDTGTSTVAMMMTKAETKARHRPGRRVRGGAAAGAPRFARRRAFSASRRASRSARSSVDAGVADSGLIPPLYRASGRPYSNLSYPVGDIRG